jgi:hypothetical protein
MPLISGEGGGGTFNGGTITQPLVIAPTDPNAVPLSIRASWNAQNADFFNIVNTDNAIVLLEVDLSGNVTVADHADAAHVVILTPGGVALKGAAGTQGPTLAPASAGFFDHAAAAQPTGVPVTAAGIHAALVSLGLITA